MPRKNTENLLANRDRRNLSRGERRPGVSQLKDFMPKGYRIAARLFLFACYVASEYYVSASYIGGQKISAVYEKNKNGRKEDVR